jgi:nucleoside-diphosphate-sugar epimerase
LVRDRTEPRALALDRAGVTLVTGNLTDARAVREAAAGCQRIYHIAALYRSARYGPQAYRAVNVEGTRHVLEAAHAAGGIRVVHCSTAGVHGAIDNAPANESSPLKPDDIYQRTKLEGEELAQSYFADTLPGTVVRPVGIYGPGDTRFLKLFRAIQSGRFRMIGPGTVLYHLTYIDDLVRGIIQCGEDERALGQTYLLAGPRYTTLNELAGAVAAAVGARVARQHIPFKPVYHAAVACEHTCRALGLEPPLHRRRLDFFSKDRAFTSQKAYREIDYHPQIDLHDGLHRAAQWYAAHGHLPQPVPGAGAPPADLETARPPEPSGV